MKDTLIKLKNISVHYGGVHALTGVDFEIDEGEVVVIMGPNGAGKSTVLKALFGLAPIASGEVLFHGAHIVPKPHEMVERGISYVPQGRRVFRRLTVRENLELGGWMTKSRTEVLRRIDEIMDIFPILREKASTPSGMLSGGQQQLLAIGRGLMTDPKVLLLDEPTLGLSPKIVKEVFAKVKEINERHKTAIVIVEHNLKSVLDIVDRAYLLARGEVVQKGDPKTLSESGIIEKVFMGKA